MPKIIDGFLFGLEYELDLLELRLEYLDNIVDYFVLVEANFTHLGAFKELFFSLNKPRFNKWLHKIVHIVLEEPRNKIPGSWDNEYYHRNALLKGFKKCNLLSDDIVSVSDLDEFPSIDGLEFYRNNNLQGTWGLLQSLHYYYINCRASIKWHGTQLSRWKEYMDGITPQEIRSRREYSQHLSVPGGWHFSYMGGIKNVNKKLNSVTESGTVAKWTDNLHLLEDAISKKEIFFNGNPLIVDNILDGTYPHNIVNKAAELYKKGYIWQ